MIDRYFYMPMKIPKHFHRLNCKSIFHQLNDAQRRLNKFETIFTFFSMIFDRFYEKMSKYRVETNPPEVKAEFEVNNTNIFSSIN
jgi:hypothetical protein